MEHNVLVPIENIKFYSHFNFPKHPHFGISKIDNFVRAKLRQMLRPGGEKTLEKKAFQLPHLTARKPVVSKSSRKHLARTFLCSFWVRGLVFLTGTWKRSQLRRRLKVAGEGNDKGWDGWMASPIQWTWVWANSRR